MLYKAFLADHNLKVITADDGLELIELAKKEDPNLINPLDQAATDATEVVSACGPTPSDSSTWKLTIVSATGGTCAGALSGGCSELYVQVNADGDNESGSIDDDPNDDDIIDPVWNYNAGNFAYTDLAEMRIKIYDYDFGTKTRFF